MEGAALTACPKPPPRAKKARKPMSRGKGLRPRSKRMAEVYAGKTDQEGRSAFVGRILRERPFCEAGRLIYSWWRNQPGLTWAAGDGCGGTAPSVDVHEILARSAGGSILDEANVLAVCRGCHEWIGRRPAAALELGLRRSRYAGRNPDPDTR
jgi:hypothetical protein